MRGDPFDVFERWLDWLVSHDGRLHRRDIGQMETEDDTAALIPTPPSRTIFTVADLRALVEAGKEWRKGKSA